MGAGPNPEPNDESLVADLRAGRAAGGAELSRRYWDAIFRFCLTYLADEQRAEDVTQETFARLADTDALPTGAFKPWLYKVARNRCLDILRRWQRSPTHHNRLHTGFDAARLTAGPRTKASRRERQVLIREIIALMPEDYRSVLTLKYYDGFSRAEIAETLGVSEATVKGRLVRASEYLREQLREITGSGA